jgi:DNA-3-methyladenine glycosylase I
MTGPLKRCPWAGDDPQMILYHDTEWGVPITDDRKLFEFLTLEGAQAGLSWRTVLHKRDGYRRAFARFAYQKVSRFGARDVRRLMDDASIIRNRQKIEATIRNARALMEVREEFGTFGKYQWQFVGGRPKINRWTAHTQIPATSAESDAMSQDMKKRGFGLVGSTILYAHMQAIGMVNDHLTNCFRWRRLARTGR